MPRLSSVDRERAIGMLNSNVPSADVARHFGVSPATITRLRDRLQQTGATADRPRSGRPRVTTPGQDRHIRLTHLRQRFRPATLTARETMGRHNARISDQTVRNRLRGFGLRARRPYRGPILNQARRNTRLQWVTQRLGWRAREWRRVLFTDESRFCLSHGDGRVRVWRREGERYADACVVQQDRWGGGSLMVWGGIHQRGRTGLIVLNGNLNAQWYVDEVLRPEVVPYVRHHNLTLQQDNARPHSARLTTTFLQQQNIDTLPWPPYSPDLSPIEHLWDLIDRGIRSRDPPPQNLHELRRVIQEEWDNISQLQIATLIGSMRRRCTEVHAAGGGHTRY